MNIKLFNTSKIHMIEMIAVQLMVEHAIHVIKKDISHNQFYAKPRKSQKTLAKFDMYMRQKHQTAKTREESDVLARPM